MADIHLGLKKLKEKFPSSVLEEKTFRGEVTVTVPKGRILEICRFLYADPDLHYHFLTDLCGLDLFPDAPRFGVAYLLYSMKNNQRLRLKTRIEEGESVASVESVWQPTGWSGRSTISSGFPSRTIRT
jgi:NADH-quinone oxidoreductase subunit C